MILVKTFFGRLFLAVSSPAMVKRMFLDYALFEIVVTWFFLGYDVRLVVYSLAFYCGCLLDLIESTEPKLIAGNTVRGPKLK